MSSKPKLTYFVSEGRGEPIRLAFLLGGVDFEDNRINYPDWPAVKNSTPWGTLPILEIDGKVLGESNTILRFVGKRTNLYPTDDWEAAKADEIMDAVEDVATAIGPTLRMPEAEKLAARQKLAETTIPFYLERLEKQLRAAGGKYFAGGKLSVADLKVAALLRWLSSGILDGIPASITDKYTALRGLLEHIESLPKVQEWRAKHAKK